MPIEFHSRWLIGTDRALTPGMRPCSAAQERRRPPAPSNLGLNGVARRQGNIFGFTLRKDLSRPQTWIPVETTVAVAVAAEAEAETQAGSDATVEVSA